MKTYTLDDLTSQVDARQHMYEWHEKADVFAPFLAKGTISLEEYLRFTNRDFKAINLEVHEGHVVEGTTLVEEKSLQDMTLEELEDILDSHDCNLTPEDGCECVDLIEEIRSR